MILWIGIAAQAKIIDPKPAANSEWFFQKVFGDGEFIAAGQLRIPPKGRKPSKGTKDNTYVSLASYISAFLKRILIAITDILYH